MIGILNGTEARAGEIREAVPAASIRGTVMHIIESAAGHQRLNWMSPGLMINTSYGGFVKSLTHQFT